MLPLPGPQWLEILIRFFWPCQPQAADLTRTADSAASLYFLDLSLWRALIAMRACKNASLAAERLAQASPGNGRLVLARCRPAVQQHRQAILIDAFSFRSDFPNRLSKLNHLSIGEGPHHRCDFIQGVAG